MGKREELNLFLERADELISSKYILADIKIVNILKAIAGSETLIALFKSCLANFDYEDAKKKYLAKSPYLSEEKGEFIVPQSSRDLLAFTFNILMEIDAKRINLSDFISKYFYVDGSFASGYNAFITLMIKPFKNTLKELVESVIEGKVQDPIEAVLEEEKKKEKEAEEQRIRAEQDEQLAKKTYGQNVKSIKQILLNDKQKIKDSKIKEELKEKMTLIIDMFGSVIASEDKDAIIYAFTAYTFMAKANKFTFIGRVRKISKLLKGVLDAI